MEINNLKSFLEEQESVTSLISSAIDKDIEITKILIGFLGNIGSTKKEIQSLLSKDVGRKTDRDMTKQVTMEQLQAANEGLEESLQHICFALGSIVSLGLAEKINNL